MIVKLSDIELLQRTEIFVNQERKASAEVIIHLREINRRKLFSELKFHSLFHYCVKGLGYSEGAATRRVKATLMADKLPEVTEMLSKGEISLSLVAEVGNLADKNGLCANEIKQFLDYGRGKSTNEFFTGLQGGRPQDPPPQLPGKELIIPDRYIKIRVTKETEEKFTILHGKLRAHGCSDREKALEWMMKAAEEKLEQKTPSESRLTSPERELKSVTPKRRREIIALTNGTCTQCGSSFQIEIEHIIPQGKGGKHNIENLTTLCRNCNQRARVREFGVYSSK